MMQKTFQMPNLATARFPQHGEISKEQMLPPKEGRTVITQEYTATTKNGKEIPAYKQEYSNTLEELTYLVRTNNLTIKMECGRIKMHTYMLKKDIVMLEFKLPKMEKDIDDSLKTLEAEQEELIQIVNDLAENKINPSGSQLKVILHTLTMQKNKIDTLEKLLN